MARPHRRSLRGGSAHDRKPNTFIDQYRRARRAPAFEELHEDTVADTKDRVPNPRDSAGESFRVPTDEELEEFLCRSVSDELKAAMDTLPPRLRLTLMLREIVGLSYQECADALEVPIGTVMSRLYRARRSLQEMLIPAVVV